MTPIPTLPPNGLRFKYFPVAEAAPSVACISDLLESPPKLTQEVSADLESSITNESDDSMKQKVIEYIRVEF